MFAMGKRFASFYRCLAFVHFWEVKFWRSLWRLDGFSQKNIYLYIFILGFFRKPGKLGSHTGSKWWPGDPDVKDDPNDPVTQRPSSMSHRFCQSPIQSDICRFRHTTLLPLHLSHLVQYTARLDAMSRCGSESVNSPRSQTRETHFLHTDSGYTDSGVLQKNSWSTNFENSEDCRQHDYYYYQFLPCS